MAQILEQLLSIYLSILSLPKNLLFSHMNDQYNPVLSSSLFCSVSTGIPFAFEYPSYKAQQISKCHITLPLQHGHIVCIIFKYQNEHK